MKFQFIVLIVRIFLLLVFLPGNSLLAKAVPFDGSEQVSSLRGHVGVEGAQVVQNKQGLRVDVPQQGEKKWAVKVFVTNRDLLSEGDPLQIVLQASGTAKDGSNAHLGIKTQPNQAPYPSYTYQDVALTPEPEKFEIMLTAPKTFLPGQFRFELFCAEKAQALQIHSLKLYSGEAVSQEPEETPVYQMDMEPAFIEIINPEKSASTVTGVLPEEFTEDSHWADLDVTYSRVDTTNRGEGALRWEVTDIRSGYSQLRLDHFPVSKQHYLKIRIALRTPTQSNLELGIRQEKSPFISIWSANVSAAPEWSIKEFSVPPLPENDDAQFVLKFMQPGLMEIDDLEIVSIPKDQMEASRSVEGNLLPQSSFPFGFHRPWRGNTEKSRGWEHSRDVTTIGPTGVPALKVVGTDVHQFIRAPFNGKPGHNHTVSFWVKGSREGLTIHPRIGPPTEQLWKGEWESVQTVGTEWQRIHNTTFLPFHADGFYELQIYFKHQEVFWLDGLMVEVADQPSEFQRTAPIELTLMPLSGDSPHNIFFPDEDMGLRCGILGEVPEGAVLEITTSVFDDEETEQTRSLPLGSRNLPVATLEFPEAKNWPAYGSYYVQVRAVDQEGRELSKRTESMVHRIRRPRYWGKRAPQSPFGVHVVQNPDMIRTAKKLGFNWVRSFNLSWSNLQQEKGGPWEWEPLDELVELYRKNDLEILGVFGGPPIWASIADGTPFPELGWWNGMLAIPDERLDVWADYAGRMAARYEDSIKIYESWNEPFLRSFFIGDVEDGKPVHAKPERLVKMTRAIRERLLDDGTDVELAWNIGVHYPNGGTFEDKAAELGMFDLVDLVTYHSYERSLGGFPGDRAASIAGIERTFLKKHGREYFRLLNSEGGPGAGHQHNVYDTLPIANVAGRELHFLKYHVRAWNSMLANGVERFFLYKLRDGGFWRGDYDLMQPDGSLGPNLLSVSNMAWHLEDKTFVEILPLRENFHAYLYEGETGVAACLIPRTFGILDIPEEIPRGWEFTDLIGNPVTGNQSIDFWLHAQPARAEDVKAILLSWWGE